MFLRLQDYNIFKLVFRWEVHMATKAFLEQGISGGGHSVEEIVRALRNVACCFDSHQGIWQSLNLITCFTTICSLMSWWRVRWAPILWTLSFSTLWNSLMVSIISMARKEISCSWHAWVTPCISHLKAGFNIVIIYLRSITPLHFNNFNNFWETTLIKVISISLLNSSQWVTKPSNDLNN